MGLFQRGCFRPWRGARKLPASLNGPVPLLNGPFTTLMGCLPECLNGPFSLLKIPCKTAHEGKASVPVRLRFGDGTVRAVPVFGSIRRFL